MSREIDHRAIVHAPDVKMATKIERRGGKPTGVTFVTYSSKKLGKKFVREYGKGYNANGSIEDL